MLQEMWHFLMDSFWPHTHQVSSAVRPVLHVVMSGPSMHVIYSYYLSTKDKTACPIFLLPLYKGQNFKTSDVMP